MGWKFPGGVKYRTANIALSLKPFSPVSCRSQYFRHKLLLVWYSSHNLLVGSAVTALVLVMLVMRVAVVMITFKLLGLIL